MHITRWLLTDRHLQDLNPLIAGEQACPPGHSFGPNVRNYTLLHYVITGRGTFYARNQAFPVGPGQVFLILPGEVTTYQADENDPWQYRWIGFNGSLAHRFSALPPVFALPWELFDGMFPGDVNNAEYLLAGGLFRLYARLFPAEAGASLATTLVGVLAVCNGLGRIITGAVFDAFGRRVTMIGANLITILSAGMTLLAVSVHSLPLCIVGLCLTGMSYGAAPTVCSAFVSAFYGQKHFATNYSIINFTAMAASFIATACNGLLAASGAYVAPFVLLLALACGALALNLCIRRP